MSKLPMEDELETELKRAYEHVDYLEREIERAESFDESKKLMARLDIAKSYASGLWRARHFVAFVKAEAEHYATKRELEAKIGAYDLKLTFNIDTDESSDYKRGFSDAMEKYDAALNNIQAELKAQKEQESK